ncbi:hypothetical protein [Streptomyces cellulosae]|uniref:Secreted protein n=1 Tax=Streptomyces cellulosae TaxID=1968 RepID=A0ABW7Y2E3_STRCE
MIKRTLQFEYMFDVIFDDRSLLTLHWGNRMPKTRNMARLASFAIPTLVMAAVVTTPADAAPALRAKCATTGAEGDNLAYWSGTVRTLDFTMSLNDNLADGHHARARLITKDNNGNTRYWAWHSDTDGANNGWKQFFLTAEDINGITNFGVQVARFEGDTVLNSCTDWK